MDINETDVIFPIHEPSPELGCRWSERQPEGFRSRVLLGHRNQLLAKPRLVINFTIREGGGSG